MSKVVLSEGLGKGNLKSGERPTNLAKTIKRCPACGTSDLIRLNVDVICGICDWDSTYAYVQAGGMDNLRVAYLEHFNKPMPKRKPKSKRMRVVEPVLPPEVACVQAPLNKALDTKSA